MQVLDKASGKNKFMQVLCQTKLNNEYVDLQKDSIYNLIQKAEEKDELHKFKKDIFFCIYKTKKDNDDSILIIFSMKLPGPISGSSASSEIVMGIVSFIEKTLSIHDFEYVRNIEDNKNVAVLSMIKKMDEFEEMEINI